MPLSDRDSKLLTTLRPDLHKYPNLVIDLLPQLNHVLLQSDIRTIEYRTNRESLEWAVNDLLECYKKRAKDLNPMAEALRAVGMDELADKIVPKREVPVSSSEAVPPIRHDASAAANPQPDPALVTDGGAQHPIMAHDSHTDETAYPNFTDPKGLAIIFNNRKFHGKWWLPKWLDWAILDERIGTDVDATRMQELLEGLGYVVIIMQDLSAAGMIAEMDRFSKNRRHEKCNSTVVVILSHGEMGKVYGSDAKSVHVESFVAKLNAIHCPALIEKPKLFFIQACRGGTHDRGAYYETDDSDGAVPDVGTNQIVMQDYREATDVVKRIPTEADVFIAYATTPGYVSWRNEASGSRFIQALCKTIKEYGSKEHICELLTRVNNVVATKVGASHVQIPDNSNRLRLKFYFYPGVTRSTQS